MTLALEPAVKECTKCGRIKPLDEFGLRLTGSRNGRTSQCFECRRRPVQRKRCLRCEKFRALTTFPANPAREDGRGTWCTACHDREARRVRNAIAFRRLRAAEAAAVAAQPEPDPAEIGVAWQKRAACNSGHGDLFFPDTLTTVEGTVQVARAKRVCAGCPVRALCERLSVGEKYGVWAGRMLQTKHTP